jgi:hypothetical protein
MVIASLLSFSRRMTFVWRRGWNDSDYETQQLGAMGLLRPRRQDHNRILARRAVTRPQDARIVYSQKGARLMQVKSAPGRIPIHSMFPSIKGIE